MQTQNLQAQESINILILSDEPKFEWELPPEYLRTAKFCPGLILLPFLTSEGSLPPFL